MKFYEFRLNVTINSFIARVGWVGALAETRHGRPRNAGFSNPAYRD